MCVWAFGTDACQPHAVQIGGTGWRMYVEYVCMYEGHIYLLGRYIYRQVGTYLICQSWSLEGGPPRSGISRPIRIGKYQAPASKAVHFNDGTDGPYHRLFIYFLTIVPDLAIGANMVPYGEFEVCCRFDFVDVPCRSPCRRITNAVPLTPVESGSIASVFIALEPLRLAVYPGLGALVQTH